MHIERNGVMCFNQVPFSIIDYMEKSVPQVLQMNEHMHQRLLTHEQSSDPHQPPKPRQNSLSRKEAYEFQPQMFYQHDKKDQRQPTIEKWFKVIMKTDTTKETKDEDQNWIKNGRVFKNKIQDKPIHEQTKNPYDLLVDSTIEDEHEDNAIEETDIFNKKSSSIDMEKINAEKEKMHERYDAEAMTVDAMQELLKSFENDHQTVAQEFEKFRQDANIKYDESLNDYNNLADQHNELAETYDKLVDDYEKKKEKVDILKKDLHNTEHSLNKVIRKNEMLEKKLKSRWKNKNSKVYRNTWIIVSNLNRCLHSN